jgi:hypothetical protein
MKSLEDFKTETRNNFNQNSTKNDNRCEHWKVNCFETSLDGKFVAYIVDRTEVTYKPHLHEKNTNWLVVANLETDEKRARSPIKYHETDLPHYKDRQIEAIIEVSNQGKVKYRTKDNRPHEF